MPKASFLKHAAVYGLGNLLVSAAGFFLLPLYVRCLSPGEYGRLEVLNQLGDVGILVLLYNGMRQALLAFQNQAKDEQEKRSVVGTALFLTAVFLGCGGALTMIFAGPISNALKLGRPGILQLGVLSIVVDALFLMLLALAQAREESTFFVLVSIGQFALRFGFCIVLVPVFGWGIEGVLTASAIASGLCAGVLLMREFRRGMSIDWRQLRAMFRYAAPLVPGGLGFFLLNGGDRFFLIKHVSEDALGAYALGYKLALAVKLVTRRPLYQVWNARMFEAARRPDAPVVFGQVFTRVLGAYLLVGLALCLVADDVVAFANDGYRAAASIIAPIALGYLFLSAADLMDAGFFIQRRTGRKTVVMLAATVVMLVLYAVLIPPFGILGAAWATVLGFLFHAVFTWIMSQQVFYVKYEWTRLTVMLVTAGMVWFAGWLLPAGWAMVPIKVVLWAMWPATLWWGGVISAEEKRVTRDIAGAAVRWIRRRKVISAECAGRHQAAA